MNQKVFRFRLSQLRIRSRLSQAVLGKMIDHTGATIGHYERGISKPDDETLAKLAEVFGVTPEWLAGDVNYD